MAHHVALEAPRTRNGGPSPAVIGAKCAECGAPGVQPYQGELRCYDHAEAIPGSRAYSKSYQKRAAIRGRAQRHPGTPQV